jgi:hypothetical protein
MGQSSSTNTEEAQQDITSFTDKLPTPTIETTVVQLTQEEIESAQFFQLWLESSYDIYALAYVFSFIDTETLLQVYVSCFTQKKQGTLYVRPKCCSLLEVLPLSIERLDLIELTKAVSRYLDCKDDKQRLRKRLFVMMNEPEDKDR